MANKQSDVQHVRVELLEISFNQGLFLDLDKSSILSSLWDEVPLGFERPKVDLSHKLDGERWSGREMILRTVVGR